MILQLSRMNPSICRPLLWAGVLAIAATLPAFGQTAAPAEVEVSGVKFGNIRQPNSQMMWYEGVIELTTKLPADGGKFTDRVKVTLNLCTEVATGKKQMSFYRASAELVALENGKAEVRFYLPPEVTKRDMLRGDLSAKYYFVELSVGGKALPTVKSDVSASLPSPTALESFRSKISSEAAANDGILLPQYLTIFAFDSSRPSPSFVRLENAH
jgi:hypothetical protein